MIHPVGMLIARPKDPLLDLKRAIVRAAGKCFLGLVWIGVAFLPAFTGRIYFRRFSDSYYTPQENPWLFWGTVGLLATIGAAVFVSGMIKLVKGVTQLMKSKI